MFNLQFDQEQYSQFIREWTTQLLWKHMGLL